MSELMRIPLPDTSVPTLQIPKQLLTTINKGLPNPKVAIRARSQQSLFTEQTMRCSLSLFPPFHPSEL